MDAKQKCSAVKIPDSLVYSLVIPRTLLGYKYFYIHTNVRCVASICPPIAADKSHFHTRFGHMSFSLGVRLMEHSVRMSPVCFRCNFVSTGSVKAPAKDSAEESVCVSACRTNRLGRMKGENAASERGMCASNKHRDKRREIQQDVTEPLTKFSLQRPRNCSNFCAMRSCALPTALRIVPNTAHTQKKKLHYQLSLQNRHTLE